MIDARGGQPTPVPLVSVVTTLLYPRWEPLTCLDSWTRGQRFPQDRIELIVVANGRRRSLEREVARMLRPQDRLVPFDSTNEMALYDRGARDARGQWILFTEPHCVADPDCITHLVDHVTAHGLAGACVRTLPTVERSPIARMEARFYLDDAETWLRDEDWRKFTKRGTLVSRTALIDVGGFDIDFRRFAEITIALKLHRRGYRLGYAPEAVITHYNSTGLGELLGYVWEYRRQERRAAAAGLIDDGTTADGDPDLVEAMRTAEVRRMLRRVMWSAGRAAARFLQPGSRGLARVLAGASVRFSGGARVSAGLRALRSAAGFATAWFWFHVPAPTEDEMFARYTRVWQTCGDLSAALMGAPAGARGRPLPLSAEGRWEVGRVPSDHLAGFHAAERWQATAFRWTSGVACLRFTATPSVPVVILSILPVRVIPPGELAVYWNWVPLTFRKERSTATTLVFSTMEVTQGAPPLEPGLLTVISVPLPPGGGGESRTLGLPLVGVELQRLSDNRRL